MPYMQSPTRGNRQLNVLVFHDQAEDPASILKGLLRASRNSPLLTRVLDTCATALRNVQASERWPLFDFAEHQLRFAESEDTEQVAVLTVVCCLAQLGCLALAWERQPSLFDFEVADTTSIGLCTGSLAAAAAACVTCPDELVAVSRELICVAFRLGLEAKRRSRNIDDRFARWSYTVRGVSEDEAQASLDTFHDSQHLPTHRKAYVSAVLPHSVTVSGPPNTLDELFKHDCALSSARRKPLHICAAFHAEHLLCPDLDIIIGNAELERYKLRPGASIGYPETVGCSGSSLHELLRCLIKECFQSRLYIQPGTNPIPKSITNDTCRIISIGQAGAGETLQDWLDPTRRLEYIQAKADFLEEGVRDPKMPDQVAITGYAGRFPHADNLQEFWDIIKEGKDVHEFVPADRFDARSHYHKLAKGRNATSSPYGCFMKTPGNFDNEFFNMSPREARQVDPIQRNLLMVTQEALEMAGYNSNTCRSRRIGTFFGQATDDYREANGGQDIDIFYVGGGMRAFAPGRLNYHYKWEGPSYSIDTACSSSLAALEFAYRAVQSGDCDIAIAGGGNLLSALPMFSGLSKGRFTSSTGSCKTFDADADGYCRGEGVGVVVIRRLEDAQAEGDNIKGIVSSIVTNHSAKASSITHPHAPTQEALFLRALSGAAIDPGDVDYVEFHGTGTQAGDAAELSSVQSVFGGKKSRYSPLAIGAIKANVGHGEAVAGVTSLIKGLLMIQHDTIPPHCGIKDKKNPALDRKEMAFVDIPQRARKFQPSESPRTILINNFNATGGNTSLILRGPPSKNATQSSSQRSHYPITISANSLTSLHQNLENLKAFVQDHEDARLSDISFSTTARRLHFPFRLVYSADSAHSLVEQIEHAKDAGAVARTTPPPVAFAFAGQGTQTQGIAKDLYNTCLSFRQSLNEYDALCSKLGFATFIEFLINPEASKEWSATQLQLGTVAIELALATMWQAWGLQPGCVIGHSLGEYPALCVAGVLSITDMFSLVGQRARLMEELITPGTHAMLSVSQPADKVKQIIEEAKIADCEISCYNAHDTIAVSGPLEDLEKLNNILAENSVRAKKLDVKYAFHSAMIEPILDQLTAFAGPIPFHKPRLPVVSTLLGAIVQDEGVFGPQYLRNHARQPVQFVKALQACAETNLATEKTMWIEVGPGNASCIPLLQRANIAGDRSHLVSSFSTKSSTWEHLSRGMSDCYKNGIEVDWTHFHEPNENRLDFLDLPTYSFDTKNFWIPLGDLDDRQGPQIQEKLTPLLHYIQKTSFDGKGKSAEFYSDLSDPELFRAIKGHQVFDAALCPSSVYSSIALEAATFLSKKSAESSDSPAFEIYRMDITRPLVVSEDNASRLLISVLGDEDGKTTVTFSTQSGSQTLQHAKCEMKTSNVESWRLDWSRMDFLVKSRIEILEQSTSESRMKLQRPVIYKLFKHVVEYDSPYHGLKSMILDNDNNEACADVEFDSKANCIHNYDWHLIDALIHLAGFILNNGLADHEHAFISDGWDSFCVPAGLEKTSKYKAHVKLAPDTEGKVFSGDAYLFSEDHIVASCSGVRFTRMKLRSLKASLGKQTNAKPPAPAKGTVSKPPSPHPQDHERLPPPSESSTKTRSIDAYSEIKRIIAKESGVALEEISESSKLSGLGLDSILVTQVVDEIKEQTGVELSSQDLQAVGAISEIKTLIGDHGKAETNGFTKEPSSIDQRQEEEPSQQSPKSNEDGARDPMPSGGDHLQIFRRVIAEQAGVSAEEVDKARKFDDIGVDSLLSLEVMDLIQEATGEEWPSTMLKDNFNMAALQKALNGGEEVSGAARSDQAQHTDVDAKAQVVEREEPHQSGCHSQRTPGSTHKAKVTLLQGSSKTSATPLFLFPPGLGTVAVYTKFAKHPDSIPIYGLTSPFAKDGLSEDFTFDNVIDMYISAILETCSRGPYHFGGWSLGGCLAYETCRRLQLRGMRVGALVILDCPAPPRLPNSVKLTPDALTVLGYDDFIRERHGSFPESLKHHNIGAMNAFKSYDAVSMKGLPNYACCIQATHGGQETFMTRAIMAQELLQKHQGNIEESRREIYERVGTSLDYISQPKSEKGRGPAGWEKLVEGIEAHVVDADHDSVFTDPQHHKTMTQILWDAIARGEEGLKERE